VNKVIIIFLLFAALSSCSTFSSTFNPKSDLVLDTADQGDTFSESDSAGSPVGCVTVSRQNVRTGPGLEYVAQKSIPLGTCVTLVSRNDAYTWVLQKEGWLYAPLLDIQGNISQLPVSEMIHTAAQSDNNNDIETSCPYGCTTSIPDCYIKGNISSSAGEKIYYLPGQRGYTSITISPEFGERWFCTETEAEANDWYKAQD
jgi:hypothetical protein